MNYYIGLDLGGTNVKAGVVDELAQVLSQTSMPTQAEGGPDRVIEVMAEAARRVVQQAGKSLGEVAGIGVGSPGPMDFDAGVVKAAPNMPGWDNVPLRDRIATATGRPTVLENDANAAAFGEFWAGAGRDPAIGHLVMLTLGTGIGSGIIVDGKLVHGADGQGGEGGHMIIQPDGRRCGCGQRGCIEAYASASHTATRAEEAVKAGDSSSLGRIMQAEGRGLTAKDVFEAAAAGDAVAQRIVDDTATYLGIACVNFCRILSPQMIVFAGGMILAGQMLFEKVRRAFDEHTWTLTQNEVRIVPAELGNDAGFIGAAAVVWDAHQAGRLA